MAEDFKLGDLVQLKSGGPVMTVDQISDEGVFTVWFAYGQRDRRWFSPHLLQAVAAPQPQPRGKMKCVCASG